MSAVVPTAVLKVVAELRDRVADLLGAELMDVRLFDHAASFVIDEAGAREEIEAARGFVDLVAAERARLARPG